MLNVLFDIENRFDYLTENGDMLPALKKLVSWVCAQRLGSARFRKSVKTWA